MSGANTAKKHTDASERLLIMACREGTQAVSKRPVNTLRSIEVQ